MQLKYWTDPSGMLHYVASALGLNRVLDMLIVALIFIFKGILAPWSGAWKWVTKKISLVQQRQI